MSKALSVDLRVRVPAAVAAGASHREVAARFGVTVASVSRWRTLEREEGTPNPTQPSPARSVEIVAVAGSRRRSP